MKNLLIVFFVFLTKLTFGQDYTFCYNSISLSLLDGGNALQIRYGNNGSIIKKVTGEWTAYGSASDIPGQTIKIQFNGSSSEYSYTLIRDGFGKPSILIDGQGRNYSFCKKENSSINNQPKSYPEDKLVTKPKQSSSFSKSIFKNASDVLYYLEAKSKFINQNSGEIINFGDLGTTMINTKGIRYFNPDINNITKTTAEIEYRSMEADNIKIIVDCKENSITDLSKNSKYFSAVKK